MLLDEMTVDVDFNGIVIFAFPDLLRYFGGQVSDGQNILKPFTETDLGDRVVDDGVVLPIINIDDGGYLVRFLDEAPSPSPQRVVAFSDAGYVLNVTARLYVADAAVFWDWETLLGWREVAVAPGSYTVTIEGVAHLGSAGSVERIGYDILLSPVSLPAKRTARLREDSRVMPLL
jgi:hypothetical protein